jgi:glutamate N-acetyltransferase/amino-acid N-acetyltransferase
MSVTAKLPNMYPVKGFCIGTARAGIKETGRCDVVVMRFEKSATLAGVFTQNAFCAAPVHVAKKHLHSGSVQYFVVNTGNANAGMGEQGMQDALTTCMAVADISKSEVTSVLPFSTGVIGEKLPVEKLVSALPEAFSNLSETNWKAAAEGILTTDTVAKGASTRIELDGQAVTITGISKGSGMIRPDMATMLAFIATDAAIDKGVLQKTLKQAVDCSFNKITVDGDTSTNDACLLVATGGSTAPLIDSVQHPDYPVLLKAINGIFETLAKAVVLDGEGATKLINIQVVGGASDEECNAVAYTIAHSPLVKTAFFASDPNWGRILAAVGRSGVRELDIELLEIFLDDVCLVKAGGRAEDYTEKRGQAVMDQEAITVRVDLKRGECSTEIWTCDLSYDYVKINAEYRT